MQVQILRPVPGCDRKIGDVVDASSWRNVRYLIDARYVAPVLIQERERPREEKRNGR